MRTLLIALLLAACGGKSSTTTPKKTGVAWANMNHEQRREYMKKKVLPTMTQEFQGLDPVRFAAMNCTTCHGERAKHGDFEMPNPGLPKLNVAEIDKLKQEKPEITQFMMQAVVPKMAALLGEEPYDPQTQKGFGCFHCHTQP